MGGEHEAQLGHNSANGWLSLYQVNSHARVSQVCCRSHAPDSGADNHDCADLFSQGHNLFSFFCFDVWSVLRWMVGISTARRLPLPSWTVFVADYTLIWLGVQLAGMLRAITHEACLG